MKWTLAIVITPVLLIAAPIYAGSLGISPSRVELQVPANGTASAEFKVYDFSGDVQIGTENIPLRISPGSANVSPDNNRLVITFYGDGNSTSRTYEGKILFLAMSGDGVNTGVKVKAKVMIADSGPGGGNGLVIGLAVAGACIAGGGAFALLRKRRPERLNR